MRGEETQTQHSAPDHRSTGEITSDLYIVRSFFLYNVENSRPSLLIFLCLWFGKWQKKIFFNGKLLSAFPKHGTVKCWMSRKESSLCIELLRLFQPFKEAVIIDKNTDRWKPSYLLMQESADRLLSSPAMPSCLHFLAETPLSFSLAEKEKWQNGKHWSLKFTLNKHMDFWISSSFLTGCLSSSCFTVSPDRGSEASPGHHGCLQKAAHSPWGSATLRANALLAAQCLATHKCPAPQHEHSCLSSFPPLTRGECLPWRSHRDAMMPSHCNHVFLALLSLS